MKTYEEMATAALQRIEEENATRQRKKKLLTRTLASAFCCCLITLTGVFIWKNIVTENTPPQIINTSASSEEQGTDKSSKQSKTITNFPASSACSYMSPRNGEYFCFIEVNEARKKYAGQNVSFLLAIDIFTQDENGKEIKRIAGEEERAEYERLAGCGFDFYEVTFWEYEGAEGKKVYHNTLAVKLTEKQLQNFKPSEKYGYSFRFITNGDSSSVDAEGANLVTNFNSPYIV